MVKDHSVREQASADGSFKRQTSGFRGTISTEGPHQPEAGRYILYVALICPWACRTLHVRSLKRLESIIQVAVLDYELTPKGWSFSKRTKEATGDPLFNSEYISEIYHKADPEYSQRCTVPALFDSKLNTIVNNESSEIIRILNSAFNELLPEGSPERLLDLYPEEHRKEIDELNDSFYESLNNGVYKTGFASKQEVYDNEVQSLFKTLDRLEGILSDDRDFVIGGKLTESDVRLYVTLIRFDVAYHTLFRCNLKIIRHDYPHIHLYLRKLYWKHQEFESWSNFEHIKKGYNNVNGDKPVPFGPVPNILPL